MTEIKMLIHKYENKKQNSFGSNLDTKAFLYFHIEEI